MHTIEPIFKVELKIVSMDMHFLLFRPIPLLVLIHRPSQLCSFHFNSLQTRYILPFSFSCIHMLWNSLSRLTVRVVRCVFEISSIKGHCRPKTKLFLLRFFLQTMFAFVFDRNLMKRRKKDRSRLYMVHDGQSPFSSVNGPPSGGLPSYNGMS